MSTSGNSNDAPKATIMSVTNPRYRPIDRTAFTWVVPANPSRKFMPFGSVSIANHSPSANSSIAEITNGIAYLRSLGFSAGVTYFQNWNNTTGSAITKPATIVVLNFTMNGSTTPWKYSAHGALGFAANCGWLFMNEQ